MMPNHLPIKIFKSVLGKPCWNVKVGHGSFLTLEFGRPHLAIREPIVAAKRSTKRVRDRLARRQVVVHGQWHLWLMYCDWVVLKKGKRLGDSRTKKSSRRAADFLSGQKLIHFSMTRGTVETVFKFDLGATLKTFPYDARGHQWSLFDPSRKVLELRADGRYSYHRSDAPTKDSSWKRL
jgi:hypothetical protein